MGEITRLLASADEGDADAWGRVITLVYADLQRLARRAIGGRGNATLSPTALVHECYLRLAHRPAGAIHDSQHLLALASRAMRQILVNHARDRMTAKRGGRAIHVAAHEVQLSADRQAREVLMLDEALTHLARHDRQLSQIVNCRIFGGLSETETAAALGISLRTMQRQWHEARDRLRLVLASD